MIDCLGVHAADKGVYDCMQCQQVSSAHAQQGRVRCSEHRKQRMLCQRVLMLLQGWLAKNPSKPKPGQQQSAAGPKKLALMNPEQQRKQQQQQRRPPLSSGPPPAQPAAAGSAADMEVDGANGAELAELLPDDEREQLEASQAALKEAQAQVRQPERSNSFA
jgi:hypothetical protein